MIPSLSNERGPLCPEVFEFRLHPLGVSEYVMVSHSLGCMFVFTPHRMIFSPKLCDGVLDIIVKV